MAEYIDRESVLEIIRKQSVGTYRGVPSYPDEISRMFREVSKIHAADVAPVVRSEWEILADDSGNEYMRCKQCGEEFYDGDNDTVDTKHNFCPNCGADMREG